MTYRLPLFPLSAVLFPGAVLALHIFEPRYRVLIQHLLAAPDAAPREFGVVAIRDGHEVGVDGVRALHPVGCVADLREVEPYPDGRFDVTVVGTRRFDVASLDTSQALWMAEVEDLEEQDGACTGQIQGLTHAVTRGFTRYRDALRGAPERFGADVDQGSAFEPFDPADPAFAAAAAVTDPGVLSYAVAAAMILEVPDKQELLAATDTAARLREEQRLLERERSLIRVLPSLPAVDLGQVTISPN